MILTREQRFTIKRDLLDAIDHDSLRWSFREVNLLLREYGCPQLSGDFSDYRELGDAIADLNDTDLVAMYSLVLGAPPADLSPEIAAEFELEATPIWKPGMVRMFLSHSAKHKKFASEVAQALTPMGIYGFVAHDSMTFDHDWQDQIQVGLKTMEVFVVLLHEEVNTSAWCQQEIGWAQGVNAPFYLVRLGADPAGFIGRKQYPQVVPEDAKQVATKIFQWLMTKEEFAEPLIDGQLSALEASTSYIESIAITTTLVQVISLSEAQWQRLDYAVLNNDQVGDSGGARRKLEPFYLEHKREWPPVEA